MMKASLLIGATLTATSLTLAAPAFATPASTQAHDTAPATTAVAPSYTPKAVMYFQDAGLTGTRSRTADESAADGYSSGAATDGMVLNSEFYKPSL